MVESNPDVAEFNSLKGGPAERPGWLRHAVDPRTWSRSDWIVTVAPLVVEAAAMALPEVELPIMGAVDLAKAFKLATSTVAGRAAVNAAAGALAGQLEGHPALGAASNVVGGLLGEGVAGVAKLIGRGAVGGIRKAALSDVSGKLHGLVAEHLPLLASGMEGHAASGLVKAFKRATPGGRSSAEHAYGAELGKVEEKIDQNLVATRQASLHTRFQAMQAGKPLRGGVVTTPATFPIHVTDGHGNWSMQHLPFKEAVAAMREKTPRGYRMTGTERDYAVAEQWRRYQNADRHAIHARLESLDPKLAKEWDAANKKWFLSHRLSDVFSDPKSIDPMTGEVNSQHVAKHLYGDTRERVAHKLELHRAAGPDFATKFHSAVVHGAREGTKSWKLPWGGKTDIPNVSDLLEMPSAPGISAGVGMHGMPHLRFHPGHGKFVPVGTDIPFKELGKPKLPFSLMRAGVRHGTQQAEEGFFGED